MKEFIKMEGAGNDFVIFDARQTPIALSNEQIRKICHRNFGIGCDQLIVLANSAKADVEMFVYNADGTSAQACGNATRCVARLLGKPAATILVGERVLHAAIEPDQSVTVNMGQPNWQGTQFEQTFAYAKPFDKGFAVDMGNPHLVFVLDTLADDEEVIRVGKYFESHSAFPHKVNVNFVAKIDGATLALKTWERGAGLTLACGSGACAAAAVLHRLGLILQPVEIKLRGGDLYLSVEDAGIKMRGLAKEVFRGTILL